MRKSPTPARLLACTALATVMTSGIAMAQQEDEPRQLDEVIVTATKTGATLLQDTPLAISAFGGEALQRSGVRDLRDLAQATPNLTISENTTFSQVYIRGVGSNNVFAGSDPSSTIHMDGVYLARPAAYFNSFLDVERVEVLRGPQGTLYGRNSVGGTVNVISRKPGDVLEGKVALGYGNYNATQVEGYISGPLVDGVLSGSLAVLYSAHDPYRENINPAGNDIEDENTRAVRGQLRWRPNAATDIVLRADYLTEDSAIMSYSKLLEPRGSPGDIVLGDYKRIANNFPHDSEREGFGAMIDASIELAPGLLLKSVTGYRKSDFAARFDTDASDLDLLRTRLHETQDQVSQEFNLTGAIGQATYVLGAYYFTETIDYPLRVQNMKTGIQTFSTPHVETENYAVFAQGEYHFNESVTASVGIRYSKETKDFTQYGSPRSIATDLPTGAIVRYSKQGDYDAWTPKVGLQWRINPNLMAYGTISRGFKSGGFVNSSLNPNQGFGPEYMWSYEAGVKSDWLDRRLRLNASAFYYKYTDLQVSFFLVPGMTDIRNAADASIKGAELEFQVLPTSTTRIEGSVSLLNAEYDSFPRAPLRNNVGFFDASGHKLNGAPEYAANVSIQQELPTIQGWSVSARVEGSLNGRRYFTPQNTQVESQGQYVLLNASLLLTAPDDKTRVTIWGRNPTDEEYVTGTGSFASARVAGRPGAPATYGVRLEYKF
jgi:iron complex outermembrane receptor protein